MSKNGEQPMRCSMAVPWLRFARFAATAATRRFIFAEFG
jgi:hypothetical protein